MLENAVQRYQTCIYVDFQEKLKQKFKINVHYIQRAEAMCPWHSTRIPSNISWMNYLNPVSGAFFCNKIKKKTHFHSLDQTLG